MQYLFKAPGKVFLFGEYFILNFGSAFLFSSKPYFEFRVYKGRGRIQGIHPKSPAGLWILKHKKDFLGFNFQFMDPYKKRGGFGASSSQFLFVCFWTWFRRKNKTPLTSKKLWSFFQETINDRKRETHEYWIEILKSNKIDGNKNQKGSLKLKMSGADLVSQWEGGILEFSLSPFFSLKHSWPFKNKDFIVASTGNKQATHEHLRLLKQTDFSSLKPPFEMALKGFKETSWQHFISGIRAFYEELLALFLVSRNTMNYVQKIAHWEGVEALKGCGAMGSDALVIFCHKPKKKILKEKLRLMGLVPVATLENVAKGFSVKN